jgi:hypothetical protein
VEDAAATSSTQLAGNSNRLQAGAGIAVIAAAGALAELKLPLTAL